MEIENLDIKLRFYKTLNERQRRQYAAQEYMGLPHGGLQLVSKAFGIDVKTINRGLNELKNDNQLAAGRIRDTGGGRKKTSIRK